jgi:hypothetical protein
MKKVTAGLKRLKSPQSKKIIGIILTLGMSAYMIYLLSSINFYLMETDASGEYERRSFILWMLCSVMIGFNIRSAFTEGGKDDTGSHRPEEKQLK